jgi:hypothetical protein
LDTALQLLVHGHECVSLELGQKVTGVKRSLGCRFGSRSTDRLLARRPTEMRRSDSSPSRG